MPGVMTGVAPNVSIAMWSGSVPRAVIAADSDCMNPSGPQR